MKTILTAFLTIGGLAWAQAPQAANPTQQFMAPDGGSVPVYRITVVARTMKAINYHHRSGSTRIGFQGTALMPAAHGEAKVESKQGAIKIDAEMQQLRTRHAVRRRVLDLCDVGRHAGRPCDQCRRDPS